MRVLYPILCGAIFLLSACSELGSYQDPTLTTTPLPSSSPSSVSVPSAVHEWQFDGSGADTGSVGGWTGSLHGSASYSSADVESGTEALELTGTAGDYFDIGVQTIPTESTIDCWVSLNSLASGQNTIIANTSTSSTPNGFILSVTAGTGRVNLETGNGTATSNIASIGVVPASTYTHVLVTMDSTGGAGDIYINGAFDTSGALQSSFSLTGSGHTYIGSMTGSTAPLDGYLDDCRIYNSTLSSAQISALYGSY